MNNGKYLMLLLVLLIATAFTHAQDTDTKVAQVFKKRLQDERN